MGRVCLFLGVGKGEGQRDGEWDCRRRKDFFYRN